MIDARTMTGHEIGGRLLQKFTVDLIGSCRSAGQPVSNFDFNSFESIVFHNLK